MMNSENELTDLNELLNKQQEYIELLEAGIDLSMMGYVICDARGYVLKVNEAQKEITGWQPEEMIGKHMSDIGKVDNHVTAAMQIIETKQPVKMERHLNTGQSFLVYGRPYFGPGNELKYVVCNLIDTTEITRTKNELEKARHQKDQLELKVQQLQSRAEFENQLIYNSSKMQKVVDLCYRIAQFDSTILITGESGVGKELIADFIFEKSDRSNQPFIKINCASIPENLLESELFGYEQGSFTGASKKGKKGILEYADKGTLLLDEIGEMSLPLQAKLLRFLQEGEFYRVGGYVVIKTDVRIIASTNRDLEEMVEEGRFREDLFYRLNVIPIKVPSLQERKEDIPLLIKFFNKKFNEKYGFSKSISLEAIEYFTRTSLKGNIRELQNIIERILLLCEHDNVELDEVVKILNNTFEEESDHIEVKKKSSLKHMVEEYEKDILQQYIDEFHTAQKVSEMLGVSQPTISRKLSKYGISSKDIQK